MTSCGQLSWSDVEGTYDVTSMTCNEQAYVDTADIEGIELKFGQTTGYLKRTDATCTYTYNQTYTWNENKVVGEFASCASSDEGSCPCGGTVSLGEATFTKSGSNIIMTQTTDTTEFGEECADPGEAGVPAAVTLTKK